MSDVVKQVKVDNWGVYFLQRLKHFFNRTDYCDLTLQFQDNAQLKVHRLVLSACTEYFELLERTCEMYEDCLVMPDDLQADVVVPIVNFMYTGQLEFRMDILENLYLTSQIMNMPVLTELLEPHRHPQVSSFMQKYREVAPSTAVHSYSNSKRSYSKGSSEVRTKATPSPSTSNLSNKRSFQKAFSTGGMIDILPNLKEKVDKKSTTKAIDPLLDTTAAPKKGVIYNPRPTRYELPEDLDADIFDDSFTNISYTSQPLIMHPDAAKHFQSKRNKFFNEASSSKSFSGTSTVDIVECKKINASNNLFADENDAPSEEEFDPLSAHLDIKPKVKKVSNQLFDQILQHEGGPKVTIETKDSKQANNIDHAKIISEVLKKYPHLVKSNKNIKLKILDAPSKCQSPSPAKKQVRRQQQRTPQYDYKFKKDEKRDFTYETDVLDSKEAARLIAMGAENINGPWICLICGAPGKALNFTSYYKFRRHLVEVHNEKPISKICEYCGLKSLKRNYMLHHMYTKHDVPPPPPYHFPKCNQCNYIALTEGFLVKHKLGHTEIRNYKCNVCTACYTTSAQLLAHIQSTGHKYSAPTKKVNLQCIYCLKVFLREPNLYTHIKTTHKQLAINDGIIEDSDEEPDRKDIIKYEQDEDEKEQYQIQQRPDGNIHLIPNNPKKQIVMSSPMKQKILNTGLNATITKTDPKPSTPSKKSSNEYTHEAHVNKMQQRNLDEGIIVIDNNEYIMKDNQLIPKRTTNNEDYVMSNMMPPDNNPLTMEPEYSEIHTTIPQNRVIDQKMVVKKPNTSQPIQIVVSNEEEYKALMNSNHSIIFDDGDANKTLTVLSTPHSTTMNTTAIDLDTTQPSDMMIIQDPNYSLQVSESIPVDNSNIVVVYSHSVDGDNKQYQLIAPQELGAQFVHTSAVITPNYESASAPVMATQVVQQHVPVSWHTTNIIQNDQTAQTQISTELQHMAIEEQQHATIATDSLSELPDVTMTSKISDSSQLQHNDKNFDQTDNHNEETADINTDQQVSVSVQNESVSSMDVDMQQEIMDNENIENSNNEDIIDKDASVSANELHIDNQKIIESENSPAQESNEENIENNIENANETCIVQEIIEEQPEEGEQHEEINAETQNLVMAEDCERTEQEAHEAVNNDPIMSSNDAESAPKIVDEQIKTLAMEWSEDEDDAAATQPEQDNEKSDKDGTETTQVPKQSKESINDSIQEDINKQIIDSQTSKPSSQNEESIPVIETEESQKLNLTSKPPPEKISSLLNDWDDNESQEESESQGDNESQEENEPANVAEVNEPPIADQESDNVETAQSTNLLPKEDDKIKSLVSDWDEDEEEKS